jgi:hypothetical protein
LLSAARPSGALAEARQPRGVVAPVGKQADRRDGRVLRLDAGEVSAHQQVRSAVIVHVRRGDAGVEVMDNAVGADPQGLRAGRNVTVASPQRRCQRSPRGSGASGLDPSGARTPSLGAGIGAAADAGDGAGAGAGAANVVSPAEFGVTSTNCTM